MRRVCPLPYQLPTGRILAMVVERGAHCSQLSAWRVAVDRPLNLEHFINAAHGFGSIGALANFARGKMGIVGESPHGR
jgi:hypothetical protein